MAISLTCVCGAILEIDDKFKGQKIPCPDCNRFLDTTPPLPPPEATSGWALASLMLSLGGMLTLIGPLAGVACGIVGLQKIQHDPKLGGRTFARAGIALGGLFTLVSVWALLGSEFLGTDGFLRLFVGARDLKSDGELTVRGDKLTGFDQCVTMKRPSFAWAVRHSPPTDGGDDAAVINLWLVNLWDDAQIIVLGLPVENGDKAEDCRASAINAFLKTSLAKTLAKLPEPPPYPLPDQIKIFKEDDANPRQQDFTVRFPWGPRTFLFHLFPQGGSKMTVAIGGTRSSRFDRLEESIKKALESCTLEQKKD